MATAPFCSGTDDTNSRRRVLMALIEIYHTKLGRIWVIASINERWLVAPRILAQCI
jgi:hypothetical protein